MLNLTNDMANLTCFEYLDLLSEIKRFYQMNLLKRGDSVVSADGMTTDYYNDYSFEGRCDIY